MIGAAWERFFFAPRSVAPLVLVRLAYGVLVVLWTLSLLPDLRAFFTDGGLLDELPAGPTGSWTLFALSSAPAFVYAVWVVLLAAAVSLLVGWHTRIAAAVVFVLVTSFERRNTGVFNAGDGLVRYLALYLALSPAGAAWAVDAARAGRDAFAELPRRAPWALRLMQIQLSVIYLSSVAEKIRGETWQDGTALSYALRIEDLERLPVLTWAADMPAVMAVFTYGTLAVELGVAICAWIPRLRVPVMTAGVALHVGIALSMRVGFFSAAMLALYLAFVPPATAERVLGSARRRLPPVRLAPKFRHRTPTS